VSEDHEEGDEMVGDAGLLVLRAVVGLLLAGHGLQKLTSWFGGRGPQAHAAFLDQLGYRPSRPLAVVHGAAEVLAGLLLATGLATPLAAGLVVAIMLNAALGVHAANGLWAQEGGMEYPLVLLAVASALALTGPGAYALDTWLGFAPQATWSLGALAAGLVGGAAALASRRLPIRHHRQEHAPA
jgi:putative oxidoreductase